MNFSRAILSIVAGSTLLAGSLSADQLLTWTFTSDGAGGTQAITLGDGSTLSGSFVFDADANGGNGAFTNPSLAVSTPTVFTTGSPTPSSPITWFVNDNQTALDGPNGCCSSSSFVYLVDAPPSTADLSNVAGYNNSAATGGGGNADAAYEIQLALGAAMADITVPAVGTTTVFIPLTGFDPTSGSGSQMGFCFPGDTVCAQVNGSAGASFSGIAGDTGSNQIGIWASVTAAPAGPPPSTPEPSTFVMLGGGLVALGAARFRKAKRA
jgi:PEP-CTERM motif